MTSPLLALDVDGPLNPYGFKGHRCPSGFTSYRWRHEVKRPVGGAYYRRLPRVWLNPEHGAELLWMQADLVWATSWNDLANTYVGPAIGLPELPVIDVGEPPVQSQQPDRLHWKVPFLAAYEPDRPMLWVDDECTAEDAKVLSELRRGRVLTYWVNPAAGLTKPDFGSINRILLNLRRA